MPAETIKLNKRISFKKFCSLLENLAEKKGFDPVIRDSRIRFEDWYIAEATDVVKISKDKSELVKLVFGTTPEGKSVHISKGNYAYNTFLMVYNLLERLNKTKEGYEENKEYSSKLSMVSEFKFDLLNRLNEMYGVTFK